MGKKKTKKKGPGIRQLDQGTFTIYQKSGAIWREVGWAWRPANLSGSVDEIWILSSRYREPGQNYDNQRMQFDWIRNESMTSFYAYVRARLATDSALRPAQQWDHGITDRGTFS